METDKPAGRPGFRPVHPGRIVKRNIDALGITVEAFADHIGTSRQTRHRDDQQMATRTGRLPRETCFGDLRAAPSAVARVLMTAVLQKLTVDG